MSAATSTERSAGRRIADSVLDAVAAPLSFIDQSTSYSRHLERRLLAEGKQRLIECLDRELATDLHEHYRSAHRTLVTGFSQMEGAYRRWRDDYIDRTLARLDRYRVTQGLGPCNVERRRAYKFWARRFVKCHQILLDLDARRLADNRPKAVLEEIVHEVPRALITFESLLGAVKELTCGSQDPGDDAASRHERLVNGYAKTFCHRCLTLWNHARASCLGVTREPSAPTGLADDHPLPGSASNDLPEISTDSSLVGGRVMPVMRRVRETFQSLETESSPPVDAPGYDPEIVFRLLFPGRPWRGTRGEGNVRAPLELDQLQRIRSVATETFRAFDECDDMSPWSLGRLKWIDRPMLRRIFTEIVERSPEPVRLDHLFGIVEQNLPPGRSFTDAEKPYVIYHLQTVVAGFSQVIDAYHDVYRASLAEPETDGEESRDDERDEGRDFGWSRLWPTVWSGSSTAVWTDHENMHGGIPLPVTYRLVFTRKRRSDTVDAVMLVPLFPIKRTLDSPPLREFFEYMHSDMVAVLPGDNQIARHPYRIAAALGQSVRILQGLGRLVDLGAKLLWYRYGKAHAKKDNETRHLELWNRSIRSFVRLGSQRHGPLDQLHARALSALPYVLPDLEGPSDDLHPLDDWSPRGRRMKKLRLLLKPVPHQMWCDTVWYLGEYWRQECGRRIGRTRLGPTSNLDANTICSLLEATLADDPLQARARRPRVQPEADPAEEGSTEPPPPTSRDELRDALYGFYSDARFIRARRNARLVAEIIRTLYAEFVDSTARGPHDPPPEIAIELLEIFVLVSLYYQAARPEPTLAAPLRLAGRIATHDLFGVTARAHLEGRHGSKMRLRVLCGLVYAPLRLTPGDVRKWLGPHTAQMPDSSVEALCLAVGTRWDEYLDRQMGMLGERLEPAVIQTRQRAAGVEPPTIASLLPEALRRCEPSTYSSLSDLFRDHITWPLTGRKENHR